MNSSSFRTYRKRIVVRNNRGQVTKYQRRKPSLLALAASVANIKKQLNTEAKFVFNNFTQSTIANTATIQNLCVIDQGVTSSTRVGDSIKIISISLNMLFEIHASATASQIRAILVRDTQTNGAAFTSTNLLNDTSVIDILVSHYNQDAGKRFIILKDELIVLSTQAGPTSHVAWNMLNIPTHVEYDGSGGGVADLVDNSISLFLVASEATNQPSITASIITKYVDN